ncbi:MAG: protein kinase [Acidobacteriota bacterium]|nr:protein kinase [Acidobacteriota bacterium]
MIRHLLEDRMLYLAFRRGWLALREGDEALRNELEWSPDEALVRLVNEQRLIPSQIKILEEDARQELRVWQDMTHDELPRQDSLAPTSPAIGISGATPTQSGEHRLWAKLSGIPEGEPWGPYRLLEVLGEGGMGRVYKALDPLLARPVALKILQHTGGRNQERFFNEARAQARVEHPYVAKVFAMGEAEGLPFIAMQYVNGTTLKEAAPKLRLEEKVRLMAQVCEGVHAAHRLGIIHRDLKPGNVMVEKNSEGAWQPLVLDFGLAWMPEGTALTQAGQTVGTPQYMSPEQARGQPLDRRSDVYALGVTCFEFICGRAPFEGDQPLDILRKATETEPPRPRTLVPDLPLDLEIIILKALEKNASDRYDSAKALGDDLTRYLNGEPIFARPLSRTGRMKKWVKRHRLLSSVVGASAATLLLVSAFSTAAVLRSKAQARAARRFSQESERLESMLAKVYALPAHNVQPAEDEVRRELDRLEQEISTQGREAEGPGRLALGRAHLALGDLAEAHSELNRAWDAGYQTSEVAESLGLAKAGLYRASLASVTGPDRDERRRELEDSLRLPALDLLRRANAGNLAAAELALTEGRFTEALVLSRKAREAEPWLYQSYLLDAEVRFTRAAAPLAARNFEEAERQVAEAEADIAKAKEVGRSAPAVYEMEARRRVDVLYRRMASSNGKPGDLEWAKSACDEALAIRPHSWKAYGSLASIYLYWAGQVEGWKQDSLPYSEAGIKAADRGLALNPQSNELLSTLAYLWWRQAQLRELAGQDPRPSLSKAVEALQRALQHPEQAATLHQRMGNCYTTQAFFELRNGENADAAVDVAEKQFEESFRLKPSGQALSDHIWALGIRAQAQVLRGQDPGPTLQAATRLFEESQALTPNYFFAQTNLADIAILRAEYRVDHGQDPGPDLARAEELARAAMKHKVGLGYALPVLGQAALQRARWKLLQKQNPSPDLASARRYFEQGRRERPNQIWPQKGLAACRLEELKARGTWDEGGYLRLQAEVKKLLLAHAKDPTLLALLARVQDFGAGDNHPQKFKTAK